MTSKDGIICPIAIDMGAKNTGVYYAKYEPSDTLEEIEKCGEVLVYDASKKAKDKYTALLKDRTAKRHARRNQQRNKLAKRLLILVLKDYFNFPAEDHSQALGFLINRRGYSFLEKTYNSEVLEDFPDSAWEALSEEVRKLLGGEKNKTKLGKTLATLADNKPKKITELVKKIDQIAANQIFKKKDKAIKDDYVYYGYLEKIKTACTLVAEDKIVTDDALKAQGKNSKNDKKNLAETAKWVIDELNKSLKNSHIITAETGTYQTDLIEQINKLNKSNAEKLAQQLPNIDKAIDAIKERETENNKSIWHFNRTNFEFNPTNIKGLENEDNKTTHAKKHLHHLCFAIYKINKEIVSGSRHRSKYFKEIQDDLKDLAEHPHNYLADLAKAITAHTQLNPDNLHKLICHISNFELKPLRAYFNNPLKKGQQHQKDDKFDLAKLSRLTAIWFLKQWVVNIEKDNQEKVSDYRELKNSWKAHDDKDDIVAFWLKTEPVYTIPPYQNMSNRHPPKCQSLLLNKTYLNKHYYDPKSDSGWQDWLKQLKLDPDYNKKLTDYGKKLGGLKNGNGTRALINQDAIQLRQFQFILDTSKAIEPYKLNEIYSYHNKLKQLTKANAKENKQAIEQEREKLDNAIKQSTLPDALKQDLKMLEEDKDGNKGLNFDEGSFGHFINKYYKTRQRAKEGRYFLHQSSKNKWLEEDKLLHICPHRPRQKKHQLWEDLAAILTIDAATLKKITQSDKPEAIEEWFRQNIPEFKKICEKAAEAQKEHRGNLKRKINYLLKHRQNGKFNKEDTELLKLIDHCKTQAQTLAKKIWSNLPKDEQKEKAEKFNSVFSFAQIHNILFEDRNGFSNTCPVCSTDNAFRRIQADQKDHANASRLSALSIRLIDGLVMRICDASSRRIANTRWKKIEDYLEDGKKVTIPLILEQNRFEFEPNLARLKGRKSESKNKQKECGLCAYSGKLLGEDDGEYDHIIPQASQYGTLNDEANLIHVSQEANKRKGDTVYSLRHLNMEYKKKIFGKTDNEEIRTYIYQHLAGQGATAKTIEPDSDNFCFGLYLSFINLNTEQQKAFRHALFLPDRGPSRQKVIDPLRQKVINAIQNRNRTIVNGTQRYMAQCIADKLYKIARKHKREKQLKFDYFEYSASDTQYLRKFYATQDPSIEKHKAKQPLYSHLIDAQMAFLLAADDHKNNGSMGLKFLEATKATIDKATGEILHNKFTETIKAGIDEATGDISLNKFYRASAIGESACKKHPLQPESTNDKISRIEKYNPNKSNLSKFIRRYIFKENAIGERYMPIVKYEYEDEDEFYIGYLQTNKGGDYDFETYCKKITNKQEQEILETIITQAKYYALSTQNGNIKIYTIKKANQYKVIDKDSHKYFSTLKQEYSEAGETDPKSFNELEKGNSDSEKYLAKLKKLKFQLEKKPTLKKLFDLQAIANNKNFENLSTEQQNTIQDCIREKTDIVQINFINKHCKYYVAKKDVISAPAVIKDKENKKYPLYKAWVDFDQAWKKEIGSDYKETEDGEYDISTIQDKWDKFCKQQLAPKPKKGKNIHKNKHAKVRKNRMIAVTTLSGTVLRVNRQAKDIYQAVPLNNNIVSKDRANFLIKHSKNLTRVSATADKDLDLSKNPIPTQEESDIKDYKIDDPKLFFKKEFLHANSLNPSALEITIKTKTSVTIEGFPLATFKDYLTASSAIANSDLDGNTSIALLTEEKSKKALEKNPNAIVAQKKAVDKDIEMTTRDGTINGIEISADEKTIQFTLPFKKKETKKLIKIDIASKTHAE